MKLQFKALLIFCGMWLVISLVLFFDSHIILKGSYEKLEQKFLLTDLNSVEKNFSKSLSALTLYTLAWAQWDDAFNFMNNKNQKFIDTNFVPGTFTSSKINFFFFYDKAGKFYYGKAYSLKENKMYNPSKELIEYLQNHNGFVEHGRPQSSKTGIMKTPQGLVVMASLPVIKATGGPPVNGALLMGYYLNDAVFSSYDDTVEGNVLFHLLPVPSSNQTLVAANKALSSGQKTYIHYTGNEKAQGFVYLKDIKNEPVGILEISMPREVYLQGLATANHYLMILILVGVGIALLMWFLLKRYVLDRVTSVSDQVIAINQEGEFNKRIHVSSKDEITTLVGYVNNMMELISQSQQKLEYIAHHDVLTGLPNRLSFHKQFARKVVDCNLKDEKMAVLFLDINNFKKINDEYGHSVGDRVLQHVASALITSIKKQDVACRLAGDEFVICVNGMESKQKINELIMQIGEELSKPIKIDGYHLVASISLGISVFPDDARDVNILLKYADKAMYAAKKNEKIFYCYYHDIRQAQGVLS